MPRHRALPRAHRGFSLIEVLIALLVLAMGLLGLAFLQVLNVRYTSSAEHRTMATNLASEVLDMMRSHPQYAVVYNRLDAASFAAYAVPAGGCSNVGDGAASAQRNVARWRCAVRSRLPGGVGHVMVVGNEGGGYTATVDVEWTDDVGARDDGDRARMKTASFRVVTTL